MEAEGRELARIHWRTEQHWLSLFDRTIEDRHGEIFPLICCILQMCIVAHDVVLRIQTITPEQIWK